MSDDLKLPETKPIPVAFIGGTGPGDLKPSAERVEIVTPGSGPNALAKIVDPIVAIIIRALNLFLVTFSAILSAEGLAATGIDPTNVIKIADFKQAVMVAAWLGFIAAFVGTVKNLITVFGKLEGKYPLSSGSI